MQFWRTSVTHPIEAQSYEVIEKHFDMGNLSTGEADVAKRIVHATADFELAESLLFSNDAISEGIRAIQQNASVICDVEMVRAGITRYPTECYLRDTVSSPSGFPTRSYSAMQRAATIHKVGSIFVVGCAPTALRALIELNNEKWFNPALIIGLPVGFIDASESKNTLTSTRFNYITNVGIKGGSPAACAAFNALYRQSLSGKND